MSEQQQDNLDQTLNKGSEVRLSNTLSKQMKIGTVKIIRELRQFTKNNQYKFSFCIGREKGWSGDPKYDFPSAEQNFRKAFDLILEGGLSDEEYDQVDEQGIEELDNLLTRFL
jgi:hypothetical protein